MPHNEKLGSTKYSYQKRCIELLSTSFVTKPSAENACTNNEIYMYLTLFILILFSDYVIKLNSKTIK